MILVRATMVAMIAVVVLTVPALVVVVLLLLLVVALHLISPCRPKFPEAGAILRAR